MNILSDQLLQMILKNGEKDSDYNEEAYAFSEAVIETYKECYTL